MGDLLGSPRVAFPFLLILFYLFVVREIVLAVAGAYFRSFSSFDAGRASVARRFTNRGIRGRRRAPVMGGAVVYSRAFSVRGAVRARVAPVYEPGHPRSTAGPSHGRAGHGGAGIRGRRTQGMSDAIIPALKHRIPSELRS